MKFRPAFAPLVLVGATLTAALLCSGCESKPTKNSAKSTAGDWPQWRGPDRSDRSPDHGLLAQWPVGGPKLHWLYKNAGLGYAGYSVVGDRLFTLGLRNDQEFLLALDTRTGTEVWSAPAGAKYPNGWGDGPRMTPTVHDGLVYAIGGQGLLVCVQAKDGKPVWQKSLVQDLGGKLPGWGYTESPLIVGDRVIVTPGGAQGTLAALDRRTGAVLWRSAELKDEAHYSSAIHITHGSQSQIVQLVEKRFFGTDPATGKVLWQVDFPGRVAVIPTPIYDQGIVYVTAGYGVGCKAVKLSADGKTTETLYENNKVMKNHHGGVVLVEGYLYGHSDGYGWVCQELATGKEVWVHKGFGKGATHFADGLLYCVDEKSGDVALVKATPQGWNEQGRFKLDPLSAQRNKQGGIWPHPVVVGGKLYLRDQENLFCFDVQGK